MRASPPEKEEHIQKLASFALTCTTQCMPAVQAKTRKNTRQKKVGSAKQTFSLGLRLNLDEVSQKIGHDGLFALGGVSLFLSRHLVFDEHCHAQGITCRTVKQIVKQAKHIIEQLNHVAIVESL